MRIGIFGASLGSTLRRNMPLIIVSGLVITTVMISPSFGVTLEALKTPIKTLKENVFNGWMIPVEIMGLACACGLSFAKQSLIPLGIGVGSVIGINFFDGFLGDGASGAII